VKRVNLELINENTDEIIKTTYTWLSIDSTRKAVDHHEIFVTIIKALHLWEKSDKFHTMTCIRCFTLNNDVTRNALLKLIYSDKNGEKYLVKKETDWEELLDDFTSDNLEKVMVVITPDGEELMKSGYFSDYLF